MKRLVSGDILEIPLNQEFGYAYAKFLNSKKIWGDKNLPDVLRVYNFTSNEKIKDTKDVNKRELLIAPFAIAGSNSLLKAGWRVVGHEEITDEDKFLPHVKSEWPLLSPKPEKWVYYENLGDTTKMHFADYEDVKHLEYARVIHFSLVPFKISMELMKLQGKDIKKVKGKLEWLEEDEYNHSYSIPPYSMQKDAFRGRSKKSKV